MVIFSALSIAGILKDLAVYITFKSNQEEIVITMCTGNNDPINTCQGSCYLTYQLKLLHDQEHGTDKQVPPTLKENITFFLIAFEDDLKPSFSIEVNPKTFYITDKTNQGYPKTVFLPPRA